jgi:hypothetical protein
MERPEQHVTDSRGASQMRTIFETLGWYVSKMEPPEYGIDFDVEVFRGGASTGITFKVQLKSSAHTNYGGGGGFVSQSLTGRRARRLVSELSCPVVLIHADVNTVRTYWTVPLLDVALTKRIVLLDDASEVAVRIPTPNLLPDSIDGLLKAVSAAEHVLACRVVADATISEFVAAVGAQNESAAVIRELQKKTEALRIDTAHRLLGNGQLADARAHLEAVFRDGNASIETRVSAVLVEELVEARRLQREDGGDEALHQLFVDTAVRLQRITRRGPAHLKFFALMQRKAAELDFLVHRDWGLFISEQGRLNSDDHDPMWTAELRFRRSRLIRRLNAKYRQCLRLLGLAAMSRHRWALVAPTVRVATALLPFILRVEQDRTIDAAVAAARLRDSGLEICRLAASFAAVTSDEQALAQASATAALFAVSDSDPADAWARSIAEGLVDPAYRQVALDLIAKAQRHRRGEHDPNAKRTTHRQIYENMFASLGIDIKADTPIARLARLGLDDINPGRALKDCAQLFGWLGTVGVLALRLRLPSAGTKVLHCLRHGHTLEGPSLDPLYADFRQKYCDGCLDRQPRSDDWEWSEAWQQVENATHAGVVARWRGFREGVEE